MRVKWFLSLMYLMALGSGLGWAQDQYVQAELIASYEQVLSGQSFPVSIRLTMAEGWHTYSKDPGEAGVATHIIWDLPSGVSVSEISWPDPIAFDTSGVVSYGYSDKVDLVSHISLPLNWPIGQVLEIKAKVQWLACKEICIPGEAPVALSLASGADAKINAAYNAMFQAKAVSQKVSTQEEGGNNLSFWFAVVLAFVGGLILNLMPCVLPVVSLKVMNFVQHANNNPKVLWRHGLVFTGGILGSFWVLVGLLMALRAGGQQLGWGFQLQSPAFVAFLVVFLFIFALNMFGVFEVGSGLGRFARFSQGRGGYMESFLSGVLATVVATPCTAPFMGPALGFALTQPLVSAFMVFTALALGLACPYLLLSANPRWMKWLPKPGAWMVTLKQFMGFPLLATALWLLWVLNLQTSADVVLKVLGALLVVALAYWVHGRWQCRVSLFVAVGVLGISLFWMKGELTVSHKNQMWIPFKKSEVVAYRKQGRAVFVNFTAAWCLTCQVNKKTTLQRPAVLKLLEQHQVVLMQADWTKKDPHITKILESFGRSGVPLYVFYPANRSLEPRILPTVLNPQIIRELLVQSKDV